MERRQKIIPRGIRNNNPLNIRIGNTWLGEVSEPTDPEFEQFTSMICGLRAAFVLMRRYIKHYRRKTIPAIIGAWAPSNENDTQRYIDFVCHRVGVNPDDEIDFGAADIMVKLVAAMAKFETGQELKREQIEQAYKLA